MLIKEITDKYPENYVLGYQKLNLYFENEYYFLGNKKHIYFETKDIKEMKNIIKLIPEYIKQYEYFISLLSKENIIKFNEDFYLKNTKNNFVLHKKIDDKSIGSRMIVFPSLISFYLYKDFVTHGHSGLHPEYIGKGLGMKLYDIIDSFLCMKSSPSSVPCMGLSTSVPALKMWNKIASKRIIKGYNDLEQYDENQLNYLDGMQKYLKLEDYEKEYMQNFNNQNIVNDIFIFLITTNIYRYKNEKVTRDTFKELDNTEQKTILDAFFLKYPKTAFYYYSLKTNNPDYKNLSEKITSEFLEETSFINISMFR